jgi:DNA-binding response OmpR family regulator
MRVAKILVVDDEFGIGELLREVLSDDDHQVVLAINGRQGLRMIAKEQPDLVSSIS